MSSGTEPASYIYNYCKFLCNLCLQEEMISNSLLCWASQKDFRKIMAILFSNWSLYVTTFNFKCIQCIANLLISCLWDSHPCIHVKIIWRLQASVYGSSVKYFLYYKDGALQHNPDQNIWTTFLSNRFPSPIPHTIRTHITNNH